jgi:hypothetical protein
MPDHREVEERSLAMARAIVARIDADPDRRGLAHARTVLERWLAARPCPALLEWERILQRSWAEIREVLLDPSEEGRRLRQSDPFCGILTPQERWEFYRAAP